MTKKFEFYGKNIEEAIEVGLKELNCSKEDVELKVLDEGTKGLFGLMGAKPARVRLTVRDDKNNNEIKKEIDFNLASKTVKEYLEKIIFLMNISINGIKISHTEDTINIEISTNSGNLLIGRAGRCINALEYVVQLMLNKHLNTRARISIDTENYRQKQKERLKTIANKAIEYVKRTKKIYRFHPMSTKERKFIHMYLKNIGGFDTFSEGEGLKRKVGVKLAVEKK